MTLHEELRELVESFGPQLLLDPEQFRAALDDYVDEGTAFPGQVNLLHDAVRFGALARCLETLARGGDPVAAIEMAGDGLARERGSLEVASARWAIATLAHATGNVDRSTLELFLGSQPSAAETVPDPPAWPTMDLPAPPLPPTIIPSAGARPTSPPPSGPPPSVPPPMAPPPTQAPPTPPSDVPQSAPLPTSVPPSPPPTAAAPPVEAAPSQPVTEAAHPAPPDSVTPRLPRTENETVTAPPRPPAPPPSMAAGTAPRRSRRKPLIAAVVAVVLAAGIATAAYAIVNRSDDPDPTAKDPARSSPTDESSAPSATGTTDAPPVLDPPEKPGLTAVPAYRAVIFTVDGSVVEEEGIELEALIDGDWTSTPPRFRLPTEEGGDEVCTKARAVRVEGDTRAPGPSAEICRASKPRTLELVPGDTDCPASAGSTCRIFTLTATGFEPRTSLTLRILGALQPSGSFEECTSRCTKTFRTDKFGRAEVAEAAAGFVGQEIRVEVGDLTASRRVG